MGGTAGLEAACTASEVGCTTFLIEKEKTLGGLARQISQIPEKTRIAHFPKYLEKSYTIYLKRSRSKR